MFANQFNNLAHSGVNHLLRGNVSVRFISIQPCQQSDCSWFHVSSQHRSDAAICTAFRRRQRVGWWLWLEAVPEQQLHQQLNHVTKPMTSRRHGLYDNEVRRLLASSMDRYFQAKCRRPSSSPYGPRTKKPKLEEEATGDVSPQSAEPTNTAECDSDTECLNSLYTVWVKKKIPP